MIYLEKAVRHAETEKPDVRQTVTKMLSDIAAGGEDLNGHNDRIDLGRGNQTISTSLKLASGFGPDPRITIPASGF